MKRRTRTLWLALTITAFMLGSSAFTNVRATDASVDWCWACRR